MDWIIAGPKLSGVRSDCKKNGCTSFAKHWEMDVGAHMSLPAGHEVGERQHLRSLVALRNRIDAVSRYCKRQDWRDAESIRVVCEALVGSSDDGPSSRLGSRHLSILQLALFLNRSDVMSKLTKGSFPAGEGGYRDDLFTSGFLPSPGMRLLTSASSISRCCTPSGVSLVGLDEYLLPLVRSDLPDHIVTILEEAAVKFEHGGGKNAKEVKGQNLRQRIRREQGGHQHSSVASSSPSIFFINDIDDAKGGGGRRLQVYADSYYSLLSEVPWSLPLERREKALALGKALMMASSSSLSSLSEIKAKGKEEGDKTAILPALSSRPAAHNWMLWHGAWLRLLENVQHLDDLIAIRRSLQGMMMKEQGTTEDILNFSMVMSAASQGTRKKNLEKPIQMCITSAMNKLTTSCSNDSRPLPYDNAHAITDAAAGGDGAVKELAICAIRSPALVAKALFMAAVSTKNQDDNATMALAYT
eukprot:jgi/Bigna1/72925/fgenesh1_pg.22_\